MIKPADKGIERPVHRDWIFRLLVVIGISYAVFLFPDPEYPSLNKDDGALFLTLGINIAEFGRYTMDMMAGSEYGLHATWPPVFPAFLGAIISVFGVSWVAIKLGMVACGLSTLVALWHLLSSTLHGRLAVLLTAASPYFFLYSHHTMAEVPYMLAVTVTLLLLDKSKSGGDLFLAGAVGAIAFLTRGYAVTLLPVGVIFVVLRKDQAFLERMRNAALFALPMLVAVVVWAAYAHFAISSGNIDEFTKGYGSGSNILQGLMRTPIEHLQRFYWHDGRNPVFLMIPLFGQETVLNSQLLFALSAALLGLVALGWVLSLKRPMSSAVIWFPSCIAIIWAGKPAFRYWLPLLPFLFFFALLGVQHLSQRFHTLRHIYPAFAASLLLTGTVGLTWLILEPVRWRYFDEYGVETRDIALWAREHLPNDAIVITESPGDIYSGARRRAFSLKRAAEEWPPSELCDEHQIYILCPTAPGAKTHYPDTFAVCHKLLNEQEFVLTKELQLLGLFAHPPDNCENY